MVGAEGIESTTKRIFNKMQGTAGTVRHCKAPETKLTDRKWIAAATAAVQRGTTVLALAHRSVGEENEQVGGFNGKVLLWAREVDSVETVSDLRRYVSVK